MKPIRKVRRKKGKAQAPLAALRLRLRFDALQHRLGATLLLWVNLPSRTAAMTTFSRLRISSGNQHNGASAESKSSV